MVAPTSAPLCSFAHQVGTTDVDWARRKMVPRSCTLEIRTLNIWRTCLARRTLTFLGDSAMRDLAMATASLLAGVPIEAAEERSLGQPNWQPAVWEANHAARKGIMQALLNESARSKQTDGSHGSYTDDMHGWTIRAFHDLPRAIHWADIPRLSRSYPPSHGVSFVQLSIHDTNAKISELGSAALQWKSSPDENWTHGKVFQPYLNHWCAVELERRRGHPTPVPLVWMTANEQCKAKKPRKWRYQAELIHAANRATVEAAERAGVPLLDWSALWVNESQKCAATTDGVHMRQWVDHHRAAILLSYLCDAAGRFTPPPRRLTKFDASAARCHREVR